jgi:hypothetical protein
MNLALIAYYIYIAFFVFIVYYIIAWIYVKMGRYVFDYLIVPAFFPLVFLNWRYLNKNQELDANKNHIAIILCNDYMPERILVYREDLPKLVKYFKKKDWPYKIYFRVNRKKLDEIINNKETTILYLVGHGNRHGIKINNKETTYFCEFDKAPKKKFIAHLHCTHNTGKALIEYLSEDSTKGFIANKKISSLGVSNFISKVTKGEIHEGP